MSEKVLIFVGDTAPKRPDMDSIFCKTADYLNSADLVFGQLEAVVSEVGAPACQSRLPLRIYPSAGPCLKKAGFDVMSNAGNHVLDRGFDGYYRTMQVMAERGIKIVGAGDNMRGTQPVYLRAGRRHRVGSLPIAQYFHRITGHYQTAPAQTPCVHNRRCPQRARSARYPVTIYTWPHPKI